MLYLIGFFILGGWRLVQVLLARWKLRQLFLSGDVGHVLEVWKGTNQRPLYPETTEPLMSATAYAAYGWLEAAHAALERARRGPAWEAAFEQRLFIETLLDVFEGDRSSAIRKAEALEHLPIGSTNLLGRRRILSLRRGLTALARAFAHCSLKTDSGLLERAAHASPLAYWAMRYARAVIAVDQGESEKIHTLLKDAPVWPKESVFSLYHEELFIHVATS